MNPDQTWGVCATIKAPAQDILRFAAHYLDAGAHRVWVHLDSPQPDAAAALRAHPKCRVVDCDETYWKRLCGRRPDKVEVRQTRNATRTYRRAQDVGWLLHADVDEFVVAERAIGDILSALPPETLTLRVRPIEILASELSGDGLHAFKRFIPPGPRRQETVNALYPTHGPYLRGGFLSHVAGKVFARTGMDDPKFRIHNVFRGEEMNPGSQEAETIALAHLHAPDWDSWRTHLDHRLEKGAYRADLGATQSGNLHAHLTEIRATLGEDGLRAFFDEVVRDSEQLRARLTKFDLLAVLDLQLEAKQHQYFPDWHPFESTV